MESKNTKKISISSFFIRFLQMRSSVVIILIVLIFIALYFLSPNFISITNFGTLSIAVASEIPVLIGMAILLISGGFDLSVGSVSAMAMVVTGLSINNGINIYLSILLGILSGVMIGLINGFFVAKLRINALIVTLGTMTIARGIPLVLTGGRAIVGFPEEFGFLGGGKIGGIYFMAIIAVVLVIAADWSLRNIRSFRQLYYVGGNEKASIFAGINITRIRIMTYTLSGALAAFSGIILTSRIMTSTPLVNQDLALKVIAAAIIGGCTLKGGEGSIIGAVLGLIFMFLINSAMVFLGISPYFQGIVIGGILIVAVSIDVLLKSKKEIL
jgi:ribose transport system permease protein